MPLVVKSEDVRSGRKVKAPRGRLTAGTGVNGLMKLAYLNSCRGVTILPHITSGHKLSPNLS